jgi:hypothetical protein
MVGVSQALRSDGVAVVRDVLTDAQCCELLAATERSLAVEAFPGPSEEGGMVDLFFLPEKESLVSANPRVHAAYSAAYGVRELTIQMHERMNYKAAGRPAQPLHIDIDLFHPDTRPGLRIQALVCFDIDPLAPAAASGTIAVCRRFNRYLSVAQHALHPTSGVEGMRLPKEYLPLLGDGAGPEPVNPKENAGRAGRYPHRFMPILAQQLRRASLLASCSPLRTGAVAGGSESINDVSVSS